MKLPILQPHMESVKNSIYRNRRGSTLVILLVFILVATTIAATSASVIISNAQITRGAAQSMEAYYAAEAGVENAALQLLRNPEYTGETLQINSDTTADIVVTNSGNYVVTSTGKSGPITRVIQANVDYTNSILTVISWKEIY